MGILQRLQSHVFRHTTPSKALKVSISPFCFLIDLSFKFNVDFDGFRRVSFFIQA